MPLPSIARDVMTVLRPVMVSDHGSLVPDWTQPPAETVNVSGCSVQPSTGADDRSHRDSMNAIFTVWAPPGTVVGTYDRVMVDEYSGPLMITGEPLVWSNKFGLDHVQINLSDWKG